MALARKKKWHQQHSSAPAVVEATAIQHWRQLWQMTGGSSGIGGGVGNGIGGTVETVG
jgi:hypothetical protein